MDSSVYVAKKLKTPIFTLDLTMNLSTTSENCFKAFIGSVSLRALDRRLARIAATIGSGVIGWGLLAPRPASGR